MRWVLARFAHRTALRRLTRTIPTCGNPLKGRARTEQVPYAALAYIQNNWGCCGALQQQHTRMQDSSTCRPYHVLRAILCFSPDTALPLLGIPLATHLLKLGGANLRVSMLHSLCAHKQQPTSSIAGHIKHLWYPFRQWNQLYCLQLRLPDCHT